jgi:predicted phosphohydrolase
MKVQYCSDLHLEFWENRNFLKENPIVTSGEILILAGDIMLFSEMYRHEDFFDFLSKSFKAVYWIPGNHEYYHSSMDGRVGPFREQIRDNIFLLNDTVEIIDDVRFVFSTLWSFVGKEAEREIWHSLNDFQLIKVGKKKLTPEVYNKLHLEAKEFLTSTLRTKFEGNTVVATHHVPTMLNYPPQYLGDALNMAFASELKPLIEETQPDYWIYGHHHVSIPAYNIDKTTMLTNQLGYVSANEFLGFDRKGSFKVGKPKMPYVTFQELAELQREELSKPRSFTLEEMRAQAERVNAQAIQSVKERIEKAKTDPKTKIDELVKEQAEIAKVFPYVITTGISVIRLRNNRVRVGAWYEVAQPNQHESTIYPKHPFYFEWDTHCGIGLVIIQLSEHVLGLDETLLIRYEKREDGIYADILLAVSKKLSEMDYESVVFYETEPLQLKEVYSISIGHSEAMK